MNCAFHDTPAVAYCRTCGTALCATCKRDVHGVIYCENCLAQRLQDVQPPAAPPGAVTPGQVVVVSSGPNPGLAAVLAGFFPFGVASVYCGQYMKGLAEMLIFAFLVWGANSAHPEWLFGIGIAFFYVYQIIDAYRTAKALQLGQPVPDPFGLSATFGSGRGIRASNIPIGALILIGLGVILLLANLGVFEFALFNRLWLPILLIGLAVWQLLRRFGYAGGSRPSTPDQCMRGLMRPTVLFTVGVLLLLQELNVISLSRTWPILLLVIGLVKILQSNISGTSGGSTLPPGDSAPPASPEQQPSSEEVNRV
ncbi:MAG TPA: DUF5668 domain-containing protein [Terriglobales bacterium]|nr:DUF5668 domain-containing protein [Terriglobales bacterium]